MDIVLVVDENLNLIIINRFMINIVFVKDLVLRRNWLFVYYFVI